MWLSVLVLAVYLLTASGHVQTLDAQQEIYVATRLVSGHGLTIRSIEFAGGGTQRGRDGRQYAAHDLGMSLVYAPLALLPRTTGPTGNPTMLMAFLSGLLDAVLGAAAVSVMALLLTELGIRPRAAALSSLCLAFATMHWVYAHVAFDVTANALAILVAVWCAVRARRSAPARWLFAGGCALGLAITIRTDTLLLAPLLSIPVLTGVWKVRRSLRQIVVRCLAWGGPLLAAVALNGWYNWYRFGSILDNGHRHDPLLRTTTPLLTGLGGQLVSPGKGMLFFSPLVLAALVGWPTFIRRHRVLALALGATIAASLVAHARLADWPGDSAWGARHTVPVLALVLLPMAFLFDDLLRTGAGPTRVSRVRNRVAWAGIAILAIAGFAVQLTAVGADYQQSARLHTRAEEVHTGAEWQAAYWKPGRSQIVRGAKALGRSFAGKDPYSYDPPAVDAGHPTPRLDLWWVRELTSRRYVTAAEVAPPLLLLAAAVAGAGLVSALRREPDAGVRRRAPDG